MSSNPRRWLLPAQMSHHLTRLRSRVPSATISFVGICALTAGALSRFFSFRDRSISAEAAVNPLLRVLCAPISVRSVLKIFPTCRNRVHTSDGGDMLSIAPHLRRRFRENFPFALPRAPLAVRGPLVPTGVAGHRRV